MNASKLEIYNDKLSEVYDDVTSEEKYGWNVPQEIFNFVRDHVDKDTYILELGAGTGEILKKLSNITKHLVGVDISGKMLEKARAKVPRAEFHKVDLNTDSISSQQKFDVIIAGGVTEFIENIDFLFQNVSDSLKSGGIFYFTFEVKENPEQNDEALPAIVSGEKLPFKVFRRTESDIFNLLEENNLEVLEHKTFTEYFRYLDGEKVPIPYELVLARKG